MAQYTRIITGGLEVTVNVANQSPFGSVNDALTTHKGTWFTYIASGVKKICKIDGINISLYTCGFLTTYVKAVLTADNQQENGFLNKYDHPEPDTNQFNYFWDLVATPGRNQGDLIAKSAVNGIAIKELGEALFDPITGEILPDWTEQA